MHRFNWRRTAQYDFLFWLLSMTITSSMILPPAQACCSLRRAAFSSGDSTGSGTKGLAAETVKDGKLVHLLGYQNSPVNLDKSGPNAMLLPIPAKAGTMSQANVLDTKSCKHFLEDIEQAVVPPEEADHLKGGYSFDASQSRVIVFEHDIYTIVLAQNAQDIPKALKLVPADKRPAPNAAIFKDYDKWYKGWTFALCCFNNKDQAKANPMLWWYEPRQPDQLFFPALDAHDGLPPRLHGQVEVDHTVAFSSNHMKADSSAGSSVRPVKYRDGNIDKRVKALLPQLVVGQKFDDELPQGDFVCATSEVRKGICRPRRELPPGAMETQKKPAQPE